MTMDPRDSANYIANLAKHVFIHPEKIRSLTELLYRALENKELKIGSINEHETFPELNETDAANYIFFLDSLNFCFWARKFEQNWIIEFDGKDYTGYYGLTAAFAKALSEGIRIFDPEVVSKFEYNDILKIFRGKHGKNINLPEKRLKCLQEVATILIKKYNGQFINCINLAEKSAMKLLNLIISDFPCFNDVALYQDKLVSFHKRAQILVADVWSWNYGKGISEFVDIGNLTMFADYRIPQVLVYFGILSYDQKLMDQLNDEVILENECEEEVEIRGCSIKAIEMLLADLNEYMKDKNKYYCNSVMIDNYLWSYRRKEANNLKSIPFHKVHSIFY